jgi:hypothetical protein
MSDDQPKNRQETERALRSLAIAAAAGAGGVILYAIPSAPSISIWSVIGVGLMLAGGFAFAGAALGFLFGIPRTLQGDGVGTAAGGDDRSQSPYVAYRVNTNLEQLSDWLTKILVGVGLIQIGSIQRATISLANVAAPGLGDRPDAQIFALTVMLYYSVIGFLFGYLWTRLVFAGELRAADAVAIGALASRVEQVARKAEQADHRIEEIERQAAKDTRALSLAQRQLNPIAGLADVLQEELDEAILAASGASRAQIFNQAWANRADNWKEPETKARMERSIPIFRALIRSDEHDDHMNHGQLGFALKDMRAPDFAEAEAELTKAIDLRGDWAEHGWLLYEFNRAICRIENDVESKRGNPSQPDNRERILQDLSAACRVAELRRALFSVAQVDEWLTRNKIDKKSL